MKILFWVVASVVSTFAKVLRPGGVRGLVAENLLLKQQLLVVRRFAKRSPDLGAAEISETVFVVDTQEETGSERSELRAGGGDCGTQAEESSIWLSSNCKDCIPNLWA